MTLHELAVVLLSTPIIGILCYGTYRFALEQNETQKTQRAKEMRGKR